MQVGWHCNISNLMLHGGGAISLLPACFSLLWGWRSCGDVLCRYLLEKHAVGLVPGDAFGLAGYVRISYAASQEQLTKAVDRIQAGLAALSKSAQKDLAIA